MNYVTSLSDILREPPIDNVSLIPDRTISIGTQQNQTRATNQDRAIVARLKNDGGYAIQLALVCDGMGGMVDGDVCAALAIATFLNEARNSTQPLTEALVACCISSANSMVYDAYAARGGTTLVGIASSESTIVAFSIGDSRIYLKTRSGAVTQLSEDDTLEAEFRRNGREFPASIPRSERNSISRFIGMGPELTPHIYLIDERTCQYAILSTDGALSSHYDADTIIQHGPDPRYIVSRLLQLSKWTGGIDNASAIALTVNLLPSASVLDHSYLTIYTPDRTLQIVQQQPLTREQSPDKKSRKPKNKETTRSQQRGQVPLSITIQETPADTSNTQGKKLHGTLDQNDTRHSDGTL